MKSAACCILLLAAISEALAAEVPTLANPSFEDTAESALPDKWNGPATVYTHDTAISHSGAASLKYTNTDPATYVLCSQPINLTPGKMYEISAWVKTQDIVGDESGATICVEYYDANGKWAGGCYPQGIKGTADWQLVKGITGRIPPEAAHCSFSCYVRQGMTGAAWWDDAALAPYAERPLATMLMSPNYRNQILGPAPDPIRVRCTTTLTDYPLELTGVRLAWQLRNETAGEPAAKGELSPVPTVQADITIDAQSLPEGRYTLDVALQSIATGESLAIDTWPITRRLNTPPRTASIDAHNRLLLNGEPFFPLGMYWGGVTPEELDIYAQSPFNCLMPYSQPGEEILDQIHARGLKIIYSVKDLYTGTAGCPPSIKTQDDEYAATKSYIEKYRDHPALLAWYINDELPLDMLDRLSLHRQWVEDLDPNHPAWVVLYQVDQVRHYLPSYDIIGTDPYPIPSNPPAMAAQYARKMTTALCGSRPIWQVPQVFNWANYKSAPEEKAKCRPPTYDEMRSMAWQSIAEGANGIIFYSWFDIRRDPSTPFEDQWERVKTVAQEIKDMIPVLLSTEAPPPVTIEPAPWLNTLVKHKDGVTHIILVNNTAEPQTATITSRHTTVKMLPLQVAMLRIHP